MKIVCISDTHDNHNQIKIPKCDLLIVAGDFTCHRDPIVTNYKSFNDWLGVQPAKHKIVVAGNHDTLFQQQPELARQLLTNATYLQDSGTTVGELKIWGSPWTPLFANWAFMKPDEELKEYWDKIPEDTDILVTHGPPIADARTGHVPTFDWAHGSKNHAGSATLLEAIDRVCPKIHIFGHIHTGFGKWYLDKGYFGGHENRKRDTILYNVAQTDDRNNLVNEPVMIEL